MAHWLIETLVYGLAANLAEDQLKRTIKNAVREANEAEQPWYYRPDPRDKMIPHLVEMLREQERKEKKR
jgi:hypothetical protein